MFSKYTARLINYILNIIHSHCQREGERLRAVLTSKYLLPPRTGNTGRESAKHSDTERERERATQRERVLFFCKESVEFHPNL